MSIKLLLIDDIGLEFEWPHISENTLPRIVSDTKEIMNWQSEHDGSTQRSYYTLPVNKNYRLPFKYNEKFDYFNHRESCGSELVSPIIRTEEEGWLDTVKTLLDVFGNQTMGFIDPKCSFHVHVNMTGAPVYVLQNVIKIWVGIESLMYRLSVAELGYHRGLMKRNFLYCRPLASPQVIVDQNLILRPSYSYQSLLQASTIKEFFVALNNTPTTKDPSKYNPVRYNGLNFFNFIKFGTVEFRTFNLSYNWKYVLAWVNLVKAICRSAFGKEYDYPPMLLGTNPKDFDLETLRVMLSLDDWTMMVLYELFYMNGWVEFESPSWQFTHLRDNRSTNWNGIKKVLLPPSIEGEEVRYYPSKDNDDFKVITSGKDLRDV